MEKINILTVLVALVLVVVVVQTIQLTFMSQQKASATGLAVASQASTGIDTNLMTADEKMNYEMHGIVPARFGGSSGSALNGLPQQVGGC